MSFMEIGSLVTILSIIGGLAKIDDIPVMIIGHEKGKGTDEKVKRNFGMPQPEGYQAKRLMKWLSSLSCLS